MGCGFSGNASEDFLQALKMDDPSIIWRGQLSILIKFEADRGDDRVIVTLGSQELEFFVMKATAASRVGVFHPVEKTNAIHFYHAPRVNGYNDLLERMESAVGYTPPLEIIFTDPRRSVDECLNFRKAREAKMVTVRPTLSEEEKRFMEENFTVWTTV